MIKLFGIKKFTTTLNLNFISGNGIGDEGAAKLGEGVSHLVNLTKLNLKF